MAEHPSLRELQEFARGLLPPDSNRRVVAHLLNGCAFCGFSLLPDLFAGASAETTDDPGYEVALDRVFSALRQHGSGALKVMVKTRQALAVLEAGGIRALAAEPRWELKSVAACEALLERSWAVRHDRPHEMLELANFAVLLADHLGPEQNDPKKLLDLRCRAWAALGNAFRVNDDLESAEWALRRAVELLMEGTGDPRLTACLLDFLASLYCAQRRFPLAFEALDAVYIIHRRLGEDHLAGRALISKGLYIGYADDPEAAVRLLTQGLEMVDRERDPELMLSAIHNISWFLMESGKFRKARNMIWEHRWRYERYGGQIDRLKLRWLQARVDSGLSNLAEAERGLKETRAALESVGMRYHYALAGLDLGSILLRRQSLEEARTVVLASTATFVELQIEGEAQKAVQ
ncbi:MAG TPA: tetratricopeptide repeat protein, partial [Thermoanaerobaculia bacterium]|nr:tetratricopeptide repeat protein [Thermoanaerobaculia bacterium]